MCSSDLRIPLYRSAVDGLILPLGSEYRNGIQKRPVSAISYALVSPSFRYPFGSSTNLARSSTGSILQHAPPNRPMFRPIQGRWESEINVIDRRTNAFRDTPVSQTKMKIVRSESLKEANAHLGQLRKIQKPQLDARNFCGLGPIYENCPLIRETPSLRPSFFLNR